MPRLPSYPGPYLIEIEYFVTISGRTLKHTSAINVVATGSPAPGSAATSVLLATGGGGTVSFSTAAADWWAVLRQMLHTSVTANLATLYRVAPMSYEKTYISSVALLPATGSGATAPAAAREDTLTFRSGNGGILQVNVQEVATVTDAVTPLVPNVGGLPQQKVAAYVLSSASVLFARDGGSPVQAKNWANTQNETIYKKRFRTV